MDDEADIIVGDDDEEDENMPVTDNEDEVGAISSALVQLVCRLLFDPLCFFTCAFVDAGVSCTVQNTDLVVVDLFCIVADMPL